MIGFLEGELIEKSQNSAIVLTGGVGYEVFLTNDSLSKAATSDAVRFYIYTHVREDSLTLYGFESKEALDFYKQLLSVSGIGPRVALAIIGSAPIEKLKSSISAGDATILSSVSGVGKKTAEKAVIELKGKIGIFEGSYAEETTETRDVVEALLGLGFPKPEIIEGLRVIPDEIKTIDEKIKYLIKNLGKSR